MGYSGCDMHTGRVRGYAAENVGDTHKGGGMAAQGATDRVGGEQRADTAPRLLPRPSPSGGGGIIMGGVVGAALGGPPGAILGAVIGLAAGELLEHRFPSESRKPRGVA